MDRSSLRTVASAPAKVGSRLSCKAVFPSLLRDDETLKEQPRQEAEEHDQQTPQEAPKDQQQK
ncbi:MAG: hypothetical protein M3M97_08620 [Actinomycetota bacterium]|nr:hypothetical protein [Actinomycetota bacterium]